MYPNLEEASICAANSKSSCKPLKDTEWHLIIIHLVEEAVISFLLVQARTSSRVHSAPR